MSVRDDPPGEVLLDRSFDLASLAETRCGVYDCMVNAGARTGQAQAFTTSVGEGLANAIQHSGGHGEVTVCRDGGALMIAEIRDHGGETPPFEVPTEPPPADRPGGRGLWMASQLCDRVRVLRSWRGTSLILELNLAT